MSQPICGRGQKGVMSAEPSWAFYLIGLFNASGDYVGPSYKGITTDLRRRLRQHNGLIAGGARFTHRTRRAGTVFKFICVLRGLTPREARQFELAAKRSRRYRGPRVVAGLRGVLTVLSRAECLRGAPRPGGLCLEWWQPQLRPALALPHAQQREVEEPDRRAILEVGSAARPWPIPPWT